MISDFYTREEKDLLANCTLCPRECRVNRFAGPTGFCRTDAGLNVASVCLHTGEEPSISGTAGIVNVFFSGCNMRCIYCQNHEISNPDASERGRLLSGNEITETICSLLSDDVNMVGFVSPSHMVPQMRAIIRAINRKGKRPVIVYNTNGYDKPEIIDSLEGIVDVFLPDLKYITPSVASEYSSAPLYPGIAIASLKRMYYMKGSTLLTDTNGLAVNGLLIRHLVIPGQAEESKKVLRAIAEELSTGVHISLMSQYYPVKYVKEHIFLGRSLYNHEYKEVVDEMEKLGFRNGYIQDIKSHRNYVPDFSKEDPFSKGAE
jgi:putative pyruvate formate lyase activating enzyme